MPPWKREREAKPPISSAATRQAVLDRFFHPAVTVLPAPPGDEQRSQGESEAAALRHDESRPSTVCQRLTPSARAWVPFLGAAIRPWLDTGWGHMSFSAT